MFDFFFKNPEIKSFLKIFEAGEWPRLTELLLTYSIRKIPMKTRDLSIKSISYLISVTPSYIPIKESLSLMKQELNDLSSAIKRIENSSNRRSSSSKSLKPSESESNSKPPSSQNTKDLKEPRTCSLKAAERLKHKKSQKTEDLSSNPSHLLKTPSTTKHSPIKSFFSNPSKIPSSLRISGSSIETSPNTCASPALFAKRN
jgi:hypothetical protein